MNVYNGQKGTKPDYSKTFNFKLNSKYTLISIDNMELTEIYLMKNKKRINLKFSKQCRLDKCFKWKRNNFLFMKGDIGLIEIYNLKRFIEIYKKDD